MKYLNIKTTLYMMDYSFPIDKEMIYHYIDKTDGIIVAVGAVKEEAFPESKYYSSAIDNINIISEEDKKNKLDLNSNLFDDILNITCKELESVGFININDYIGYEFSVAYIYPNEKGMEIIKQLKKKSIYWNPIDERYSKSNKLDNDISKGSIYHYETTLLFNEIDKEKLSVRFKFKKYNFLCTIDKKDLLYTDISKLPILEKDEILFKVLDIKDNEVYILPIIINKN